jgi:hypothetical protein
MNDLFSVASETLRVTSAKAESLEIISINLFLKA